MTDRNLQAADVEREHVAEVHPPVQWAYLLGVPFLGFFGMLALIAFLGAVST